VRGLREVIVIHTDVRVRVTFKGQFLLRLFQYRSESTGVVYISFSRERGGEEKYEYCGVTRKLSACLPIALKLGTDCTGPGTPEVVAYDPIALVFEHALVERFDVAPVGG